MKAFISYSHKDESYLERLKVHLTQMNRDGLISEWNDKEIHAGSSLDDSISDALTSSELFLALVSPDYIASNYCYEKEFRTALQMHEEKKLIVVPIIVEPCDWQNAPFGKIKSLPKDGKAVAEWTNANNAFLNIIQELRRLLNSSKASVPVQNIQAVGTTEKVVRDYKVKRTFSEVDKYSFREASYKEIKNYFNSSILELDSLENLQALFTNDGKGFFTCLISNRANNQDRYLTVQIGGEGQRHYGDLSYSFSDQISTNSIQMDKVYRIDYDDYHQFWTKNSPMFGYSGDLDKQLTAHQVAEEIWNEFISQVGVSIG
ncbi:toll/interleukin-1 receptor domain-containing protein [Chryseobacterium sp. JJR-5R]|uniref:toll/interleukin-1 receptor domain-containing protein n=1 Tax=Chryseobacterium sp. JJR-5R TaxID=3093923 RepID=UPI002A7494B2|nr:toll/interleukin-1 receptor domain-containing protein [Chryseobacterium sp. JJR-5R]WPO84372.1 toll/interleukin-1 receptor domain-containing protein [Chryseobacterium sp. JJR-5R]